MSDYFKSLPYRRILRLPVHRDGWHRFTDGERLAGKPRQRCAQSHFLLDSTIKSLRPGAANHLICFCFKAALSIFGMISGPLLGLYLLGMLFRTPNSTVSRNIQYIYIYIFLTGMFSCITHPVTSEVKQPWRIQKVFDCGRVCFAGWTYGNDCRPSVDSMGGDWGPDLPTTRRQDPTSATQHSELQQHELHGSSVDHSGSCDW